MTGYKIKDVKELRIQLIIFTTKNIFIHSENILKFVNADIKNNDADFY